MLKKFQILWPVIAAAILGTPAQANLPVTAPTYTEMLERSELVCVLEVIHVAESPKPHPNNPLPEDIKSYVATCKVLSVLKGNPPEGEIRIPFWGHLFDPPSYHFVAPLVETTQRQHEWIHYLAYLKRGKDGVFVPTTGDQDAGFSFRVLLDSVDSDGWKILRQRQSKHNETGASNRSQPAGSETNRASAAAGSGR